jgi:predicted transport protein
VINTDDGLKNEFKQYLGPQEVYKFLSDIIESSQNILLIADGRVDELPEITETYTDTWGKMVRYLEVRKFGFGADTIYTIEPDFETLQYEPGETSEDDEEEAVKDERPKYSEAYHLEGVSQTAIDIYNRIKEISNGIDPNLIFNPQKYYISIKAGKNIAFIKVRIKKIRLIAMMPEKEIRSCVKYHAVATLSEPVQEFYNGACAAVDIQSLEHFDEIEALIRKVVAHNKGGA